MSFYSKTAIRGNRKRSPIVSTGDRPVWRISRNEGIINANAGQYFRSILLNFRNLPIIMPTYFKPLRRKMGMVTLMMACVMAAGWVRSFSILEHAYSPLGQQSMVYFSSGDGFICCGRAHARTLDYFPRKLGWYIVPDVRLEAFLLDWRWIARYAGFGIAVVETSAQVDQNLFVIFPYWSMVIPLTLLSAWLLLSKPRVAKPTATVEK